MQNNKLVFGIIIGALIGGLSTLFDQETRSRTKVQYLSAKRKTNYYMKHPSEAVQNARVACNQFNETFNTSADNAINALEQVEQTIDKVTNRKDVSPQKIESIK
ncbi:YtxH domain-containing protein [Virgibacillus necropolis]|uniref:YtxH domain-containing protein n=1 Tax=Virgibacillus necropolis TaxID=163877 RepID=UPI0038517DA7